MIHSETDTLLALPAKGATRLPDWLTAQVARGPGRPAIFAAGVAWTFGDLQREALALAGRLRAAGVTPGAPVAVLMGAGAGFAAVVHALMQLDAVLVPLNLRLTPDELAWQVADCGAGLLLHDGPRAESARRAAAPTAARCLDVTTRDAVESGGASIAPRRDVALDAPQAVIYTSGTTGRPKGAVLTYGNHWWSAIGSALNLGALPDDRWLACMPLFHVGGLAILMRGVIYGAAVIIHESFDPAAVNRAIDSEGVTVVSVVSAMLRRMLDERAGRPYPPSLRAVLLGGGPAPRPLLEDAARAGAPVVQTYGLTETCSQVATLPPADALRKLGSAGLPLLPTSLRIAGPAGALPPGVVGEIIVRGPTVTPGYLGRPDATAEAIRDGWLHTGDLGYLDAEGYLYVLDRRDDLIISGGENVYPAEVEAALLAHPAVADAGVIGRPDPRWGQTPVALVQLRPGAAASAADLIAFCRARLAAYKTPAAVEFVDTLPRNAAGKLLRRVLRPDSSRETQQ